MTLFRWSRTAANNGTADITAPFPEGMGAPALNDGARGMMAAVAKYRDDIAGANVTGGSSTNYTLSSFQVFDTTSHFDGQSIAFTPHVTNDAGPVRLVVDGFTVFLRSAPNIDLLAGVLIAGTPYIGTYRAADNSIYLQGFYGNPFNIPISGCVDYFGQSAPNSAFAFPFGQAISRTTYSTLFGLIGAIFGGGDGSTTFNLPDIRGRTVFGADNMGGTGVSRLPGGALSAVGGAAAVNIAQNQLPNVAPGFAGTPNQTISVVSTNNNVLFGTLGGSNTAQTGGGTGVPTGSSFVSNAVTSTGNFTATGTVSSINGGVAQNAMTTLPPYIAANKIIRVL